MDGPTRDCIYKRWLRRGGHQKITEAKKAKQQKEETRIRSTRKVMGVQEKSLRALFDGFQRIAKSLSRKKQQEQEPDDGESWTRYNALKGQWLFQSKQKKAIKAWKDDQEGADKDSETSFRMSVDSGPETVYTEPLEWAKSGTWPSQFSSRRQTKPSSSGTTRSGLYERWLEANRAAILAAQQRVRQLRRSGLNAAGLREVFERNHRDERQDAIQGKKFTYAWILEQQQLLPLRLANLEQGRPAEELECAEWRYGDCINATHPWENDVEFDFED